MGRRAPVAWSVAGILGFFAFLGVAAYTASLGFALCIGAPHAFPPAPRLGAVFFVVALLFVILAIFLLRRSVRRLRGARRGY